jgi:hypothetical protein
MKSRTALKVGPVKWKILNRFSFSRTGLPRNRRSVKRWTGSSKISSLNFKTRKILIIKFSSQLLIQLISQGKMSSSGKNLK